MHVPKNYVPSSLSLSDKSKQLGMIRKSRRLYKKHIFYTRKKVSYPHKESKHIKKAKRLYGPMVVNQSLANKTGCPLSALKEIVRKGEGAYYSSGSRPNQTPQSWGLARLASALTGGPASKVDASILKKCTSKKQ
jgi:hypothetical protein